MAISYVLTVLASLGVALTVTPALSLILLPRVSGERRECPLTRLLKRACRALFMPALYWLVGAKKREQVARIGILSPRNTPVSRPLPSCGLNTARNAFSAAG
jgi:Cu/Ag efflux pump CusA